MKRLYRYSSDRKIAGVCAGLGEYFDLDPLVFRIAFLVSLFFGGLGAFAYLVLWVMLPETSEATRLSAASSQLHLSSTERQLGGVAGGLAEFFGIDPVLFRAGFIVLALIGGLGLVLYVALWLLMRPAPATRGSDSSVANV